MEESSKRGIKGKGSKGLRGEELSFEILFLDHYPQLHSVEALQSDLETAL